MIDADSLVREAVMMMRREQREAVPVIDEQHRLVGLFRAMSLLGDADLADT